MSAAPNLQSLHHLQRSIEYQTVQSTINPTIKRGMDLMADCMSASVEILKPLERSRGSEPVKVSHHVAIGLALFVTSALTGGLKDLDEKKW